MIFAPPDALVGFTIYEKPSDYPESFVVRKWVVMPGVSDPVSDPDCKLAPTLDSARAFIPDGMHRLPREPDDDPVIVEVWI